MPDTPSITIVKSFDYRGVPEEWSNRYHFSGTVPTDTAGWKTLADAIIAAERPVVSSAVTFVKAYGYVAGNDNSVAQIDYHISPAVVLSGTFVPTGGQRCPGDVAATVRWYTGASSTRGKKIYCRKYIHDVYFATNDPDNVLALQRTALGVYGAKMIDGTLPGSAKYCGPQGAVLSAPTVDIHTTTRTLKRRGKRPPT
jgi:hypothetical protein